MMNKTAAAVSYGGFKKSEEKSKGVRFGRPVVRQIEVQTNYLPSARIIAIRPSTAVSASRFTVNKRLELGLRDILRLKDNWNSYGAKAPTKNSVLLAFKIAEEFPPSFQPEVYPDTDGSVGFTWEIGKNTIYLSVSEDTREHVHWYIENEFGDQLTKDGTLDIIASAIRSFIVSET